MSKDKKTATKRNPWAWIPSLYFAQGLPYVAVMTISVIMYKRLGMSNTDIALYTGWLGLPWVIKPFWSPFVDIIKTKRWWVLIMQWIIAIALAGIAFTIPTAWWVQLTFAVFMLMGFSSATHDIAADGFYMLALTEHEQSLFVGIRSTFYRIATVVGQGLLVILAGVVEMNSGLEPVRIDISANPQATPIVAEMPTISENNNNNSGEIRFITSATKIKTSVKAPTDGQWGDSILAFADYNKNISDSINNANIANGFYIPDPAFNKDDKLVYKDKTEFKLDSASWQKDHYVYFGKDVDNNVIKTLENELSKKEEKKSGFENWIATKFPDKFKEIKSDAAASNFAVVAVRLNKQPKAGEEYILNIANDKGSTDIKATQTRFVFNDKNWDKPAYIHFSIDNKIKENVSSSFIGTSGNIPLAWALVFVVLSVFFFLVALYHTWALPRPAVDTNQEKKTAKEIASGFFDTFKTFFTKFPVWQTIAGILFMLFYRFPEAQLTKIIMPFLVDPLNKGGLALSTSEVGIVYGTVGIIGLTIGGIIGGVVAAKGGLKKWLHPMAWSMSLTCLTFIYLAFSQDQSFLTINICVFIEQFGYGFGFTAYMLYLIYYSEGKYKTAHYAICTGFMALSMMMGMIAGWLEDLIGYRNFFIWTMICCLFTIGAALIIKVDPSFGLKEKNDENKS